MQIGDPRARRDAASSPRGGAEGEELLTLLRRVRDALLEPSARLQFEAGRLYWQLASDIDAALAVLLEWISEAEEAKLAVARTLIRDMPWTVPLSHPEFVQASLEAADARGADSLAELGGLLLSVATVYGTQSRTMGQPPPRYVMLRDQGTERAAALAPGSPAREFYEAVVARAEARLAEAALEDEEYPELDG
jgi:hypothetical protein